MTCPYTSVPTKEPRNNNPNEIHPWDPGRLCRLCAGIIILPSL